MLSFFRGVEHPTFLEETFDGGGQGIEVDGFFEEFGSGPGLIEGKEHGLPLFVEVFHKAREQDDRDGLGLGVTLEFLGEDESFGVGFHHDIEDDEVWARGGDELFGFCTGGGAGDTISSWREESLDGKEQVAVVIDEQDMVSVHGWPPMGLIPISFTVSQ
jgi:hypothetical protein